MDCSPMAHLRVEARGGVLGLLNEAGHVFEEEVVHVLLVHVPQLDALGRVAVGNGVTGVARHSQSIQPSEPNYGT